MPDHPLLDRVVRGRAWIAVLGVMLAGIVAMQIEVLKLGASIGRSLQRGTSLQSRNEQLRASVAELGDDQRIERLAAAMGMVMPAPDGVGFVSVGPATVEKAIANIHQPNPAAFLSQSVPNGAVTGASIATGTSTATNTSTAANSSTATNTSTAAGAGTTGTVPGAGTTGATGTAPAGTPATGPASSTGVSGQGTPAAATSAPVITTQPATPASSVPPQTTSPASAATGAAGTAAAIVPTQSPSPTAATGGAGVPAAG